MALKTITKKVLSYSEIPNNIDVPEFIVNADDGLLIECHLDDSTLNNELDDWILKNYPELKDEESFFIEIDY